MSDIVVVETIMGEDMDLGVSTASKTHATGGSIPGTQVNLTTFSRRGPDAAADTATWDPGSVAAAQSVTTTITVSGAALGDLVMLSFSLDLNGCTLTGYVSSVNTVTAVLHNPTTAAVDLSSGTLKALVFAVR